jgi:hypothetical protein
MHAYLWRRRAPRLRLRTRKRTVVKSVVILHGDSHWLRHDRSSWVSCNLFTLIIKALGYIKHSTQDDCTEDSRSKRTASDWLSSTPNEDVVQRRASENQK